MATPVTTPPSSAPPVTPTEQDFTTSSTRRHARQTTQDSDAEGAYDHTGDIGHDRLLGEQVDFKRDRRSREKGKGRMIIEEERGDDDDDDDDDGDAGPTVTAAAFPPEQGDQDEREAKRIADNLAAWSRAETKRRKTMRKNSQQLVMPPPPPPLPSATVLARRSSALIRAGSRRIAQNTTTAMHADKIEALGDQSASAAESRRHRRNDSIPLQDRSSMDRASATASIGTDTTTISTPVTAPTNPFASRPPSAFRGTSYDSYNNNGGQLQPHTSRFIEDLPLQSPVGSPDKAANPFASRQASLDYALPRPLPLPSPAASTASSSQNPFSDSSRMRPRTDTLDSQHTVTATASIRQEGEGIEEREWERARAQERGRGSAEYEGDIYRQRRDYFAPSSRTSRRMAVNDDELEYGNDDDGDYGDGNEQEEDDDEEGERDDDRLGWLGWLFCGCFRTDEDGEQQTGRTNPME